MSCNVIINKNANIIPNNPRFDLPNSNFNSFAGLTLTTFDIGINLIGNIRLMPNNTEALRILNNKYIGINNSTPKYILDVNGTSNFTGSINANNFIGNMITTGINWKIIQYSNFAYNPACITYGNGIFVACLVNSYVVYSSDGINWNLGNFYTGVYSNGFNICFGNGVFIILVYYTQSGGSYPYLWVTPDAINAQKVDLSAITTNLTNICYGNNTFVIVCNGGINRVLTSSNGINWTISATTTSSTTYDSSWNSVCYGNGQFVAVANAGNSLNTGQRSITSPDGYTWTVKTTPSDNNWQSICYANGLFVAVGSSGTNRVMTYSGGSNSWILISTGESTELWVSICYGNGLYVAVANNGNYRIMISTNAINWKLLTYPSNQYGSICYGNGIFVIGIVNTGELTYFLVSGIQIENITSSGASMTYDNMYANKSLTIYDNTNLPRTTSGLQYKDVSDSHIWSLVKNTTNNNLCFSSSNGYTFYVNGTSSLNGTFALGISNTGNIQIGSTMTFNPNYAIPKHYVNGNVCITGSTNIKTTVSNSIALNIGDFHCDSVTYGLVQLSQFNYFTNHSFFSFIRYSTGDYWQIGSIYNNSNGMSIYGSGGRFQNKETSIPCFTMLDSYVGINATTITNALDVSGSGRFTSNLQSGNLTCNKITVSNINIWYITCTTSSTITVPINGNIGATNSGFGNVFLNGSATETIPTSSTSWDTSTATFTAPNTGLYMFNLHVFDLSANGTKGNCLQICGNGLLKPQPNGGQYLTFGQAYNSSEGAYVITQTFVLSTGNTIYYKNTGTDGLKWLYGNSYTNLTITKLS